MSCPGLKVLAPYSAQDAKGLLKAAIRDDDPVVFLEQELAYGMQFDISNEPEVAQDDYVLPIGKAKIERSGTDLTIVAYSLEVATCLKAADALAKNENIECEVINLRSLRPLDFESIKNSVEKTRHLVVVDGSWPQCSVASEISAQIAESPTFYSLDGPIYRVTCADVPMPYAPNLEKMAIPQVENITQAVKAVLHK